MCLIFDKFDTRQQAERFAMTVKESYSLDTWVFDTHDESDANDPFPFRLDPPIVHVERPRDQFDGGIAIEREAVEDAVEELVQQYGGAFAGT